jgi:hypothetical protein
MKDVDVIFQCNPFMASLTGSSVHSALRVCLAHRLCAAGFTAFIAHAVSMPELALTLRALAFCAEEFCCLAHRKTLAGLLNKVPARPWLLALRRKRECIILSTYWLRVRSILRSGWPRHPGTKLEFVDSVETVTNPQKNTGMANQPGSQCDPSPLLSSGIEPPRLSTSKLGNALYTHTPLRLSQLASVLWWIRRESNPRPKSLPSSVDVRNLKTTSSLPCIPQ